MRIMSTRGGMRIVVTSPFRPQNHIPTFESSSLPRNLIVVKPRKFLKLSRSLRGGSLIGGQGKSTYIVGRASTVTNRWSGKGDEDSPPAMSILFRHAIDTNRQM